MSDFWGETISVYSRAQAIEDGVLIDVSQMAREAGFKYPTVITTAVYSELSAVEGKAGQSFAGRLWDVLNVMRHAKPEGDRVYFTVLVSGRKYELYAVCGPGDTEAPVLTIMEQGED
jgi:hypothetical protein